MARQIKFRCTQIEQLAPALFRIKLLAVKSEKNSGLYAASLELEMKSCQNYKIGGEYDFKCRCDGNGYTYET